jgi:hypothetical protein
MDMKLTPGLRSLSLRSQAVWVFGRECVRGTGLLWCEWFDAGTGAHDDLGALTKVHARLSDADKYRNYLLPGGSRGRGFGPHRVKRF